MRPVGVSVVGQGLGRPAGRRSGGGYAVPPELSRLWLAAIRSRSLVAAASPRRERCRPAGWLASWPETGSMIGPRRGSSRWGDLDPPYMVALREELVLS